MPVTPSLLKSKYPWLTGQDDTRLSLFLSSAATQLDPHVYGEQLDRAVELWVLCQLVQSTPELRSQLATASESISAQGRSVSVSYADRRRDGSGGNWFCDEFEVLTRALTIGGIVI
jgi:hypothetical protein